MLSKKNLRLRLLPRRSTTTTRRRLRRLVSQYMVSRHRQRRCQKASAVAQLVHSTPLAGTKIKSPAQRRAREKEMEKKKRTKLCLTIFSSLSLYRLASDFCFFFLVYFLPFFERFRSVRDILRLTTFLNQPLQWIQIKIKSRGDLKIKIIAMVIRVSHSIEVLYR